MSTPPKAEGVRVWEKLVEEIIRSGFIAVMGGSEEWNPEFRKEEYIREVKKYSLIIFQALTSATRAAEERKDGEVLEKLNKIHLEYESRHEGTLYIKGFWAGVEAVHKTLLPPPPDKPTTNG